jgi:hypothetical protein
VMVVSAVVVVTVVGTLQFKIVSKDIPVHIIWS